MVNREASEDLSANDLRKWLSDAICDAPKDPGDWCYLEDWVGDSQSGDVIYCCCGDMMSAPYEIKDVNGKMTAVVDFEAAVDVLPRTVYEPEADEADHYAAMESAKLYAPNSTPIYERAISKKMRDEASPESFAGKGKSFPILKRSDVMAAVRSMGRAGADNYDAATLKSNIIRIAKAKGFASSLPKAWTKESAPLQERGARNSAADKTHIQAIHDHAASLGADCGPDEETPAQESARTVEDAALTLVESAGAEWLETIDLKEASRTTYPIRIINPGTGTTAHYPADVLKREASKFGPGTLMFWNHPTALEESQRPEGDLNNLAAIITTQGKWEDNGPKGPGIYAEAKVMADYADKVAERAPHIGLSIRAGGRADGDKRIDGKPVLKGFDYIESVDWVTKAGRGGMALVEAARGAGLLPNEQTEEQNMAENEQLREALAELKKLKQREAVRDAGAAIDKYFRSIQVAEGVKNRVTERLLAGSIPLTESGDLDTAKLNQFAEAQVKDELEYLGRITGRNLVVGMGSTAAATAAPTQEQLRESEQKRVVEYDRRASLFGFEENQKQGRAILREGRAAFDPNYNARKNGTGTLAGVGMEL